MTVALELAHITRRFGALVANDDVSITLAQGEVLALLGENGAGKTTLMNILFGHYTADAGEVRVFGRKLPPGRPRAAIEAGVGMVHQHFTLAANLTVLDNIMIGTEKLTAWRSDRQAARAKLARLADRFGLVVDPDARIGDLSVGERQRVEILKALYRDARILVLDEPTAVLTQIEAETLFATLRDMARQGLSVIFISHKLGEVMTAADRVVVLRAGRVVAERRTVATSREELAELMVGRRVQRPVREANATGTLCFAAESVSVLDNGQALLTDVSLALHGGEVLGIVGVAGNGQAALGRLAAGLARPTRGTVRLGGEIVSAPTARGFIAAGVGRVPEDRHALGAIGDMSVWENAILERARARFTRRGVVDRAAARGHASELIRRFDIRGGGPETRARLLSGGNLQKLILGRNLAAEPHFLVANQPTRGLDEGAIAAVHGEILAARGRGVGVLLISEDLDEVLALADRVQVIYRGRLSKAMPTDGIDARTIGLMMGGVFETAA